MTAAEDMRQARRLVLENWPLGLFLSDQARRDFVNGLCVLREYDGVPIVDYTKPWAERGYPA